MNHLPEKQPSHPSPRQLKRQAVVRKISDAPPKKRAAMVLGEALATFLPWQRRRVEHGDRINSMRLVDRLIRNGIRAKAFRSGDHAHLREMAGHYWGFEAEIFSDQHDFRFEDDFLNYNSCLFDHLESSLHAPVREIYEIGCGNGKVLEYLAGRFPEAEKLVGIDISQSQIDSNQAGYADERLSFVAGDGLEWLRENAKPESLVVTNGGVLEYFLKSEVLELLTFVQTLGNCAVALIETMGSNHDIDCDYETRVYGPELSFSHHYPQLVKEAGFQLIHQSEFFSREGNRWVRVAGVPADS